MVQQVNQRQYGNIEVARPQVNRPQTPKFYVTH